MDRFKDLHDDFTRQMDRFHESGKKCMASSSLQTNSVVLLHMISQFAPKTPVYFLNTGFHFPETFQYKSELESMLGLKIREIRSRTAKINQRDEDGRMLYTVDPDRCCQINKTEPMEEVVSGYSVWISGVRASQSKYRSTFSKLERGTSGVLHYHPLLGMTSRDVFNYIKQYDLPKHPLYEKGYFTVGCIPCTEAPTGVMDDNRAGRWLGLNKSECGLHTDLRQGSK